LAIARALISVHDKAGIEEFAWRLSAMEIELVSTGGTSRLLRDAGIAVRDVAELTGWPEMLGGRVKTLHPKVHGAILFRRKLAEDQRQAAEHGIAPIDLVVVNLYPFETTAAKAGLTPQELIENIDIGGPTMLRSAAKNFEDVAVVTDPEDYGRVADELSSRRELSLATRLELARKAFAMTARYDGIIAMELERLASDGEALQLGNSPALPKRFYLALAEQQPMRYGENPHQQAALYIPAGGQAAGFAAAKRLQGKELSYNNLADLDSAWKLVQEFSRPATAIIKHNNPCGAAEGETLEDSYRAALACDPVSAFGGIVAFNRTLDLQTAGEVGKLFTECVVAPDFDNGARETLAAKKNLRLLAMGADSIQRVNAKGKSRGELELRRISGGVLVQTPDTHVLGASDIKTVTKRSPTEQELADLLFAWRVCKHVKSNAIVFAGAGKTIGIGAGQMSRIDAVKIAVAKAQQSLAGTVMASDAFFFPDTVEAATKAGATAAIQPGGSVRDVEVIAAADALGMAMVFTGIRHFRH
jgi:phosphoribosylaminoimidazolecarboxamide formyltransferase/IMP cyclohydrolase